MHVELYPPARPPSPPPIGGRAFVRLKSNKSSGGASVLSLPLDDGEFAGRQRVAFDDGSGEAHVRPARLTRIWLRSDAPRVLIARETDAYRNLARSQPDGDDYVLEVGSSHGHATALLAERTPHSHILGVEISPSLIAHARASLPRIRFEEIDALEEPRRLLEVAAGMRASSAANEAGSVGASSSTVGGGPSSSTTLGGPSTDGGPSSDGPSIEGPTIVFVDVGGNRPLPALLGLLTHVVDRLRPRLLVVKCRELHAAALGLARSSESALTWEGELLPALRARVMACQGVGRDCAASGAGAAPAAAAGAKASPFSLYPLKQKPKRAAPSAAHPEGVLICRFHNFGVCKRGEACGYDHQTCHYCEGLGHVARECPAARRDLAPA